jgi:hypothetical protein
VASAPSTAITAPATTSAHARRRASKSSKVSRNEAGHRVQHRSPSSRARRRAKLRSTRLTHPTRSGNRPRHSQTSVDCLLAIPKNHLPRNHLGSPTHRAQICIFLRAQQRCVPLAASPTTPGHLQRLRNRHRIPTQDHRRCRRLAKCPRKKRAPRCADHAHMHQRYCHQLWRDTFPAALIFHL